MAFPLLISSLFIFLSFLKQSVTANLHFCPQSSCSPTSLPIRFPFGLKSESRCTYPGFDLSCNNQSQTTLNLPFAGSFVVTHIDYQIQGIRIRDPENCLAARFLTDFSLAGSPFFGGLRRSVVFLNCSARNISQIPPLPVAIYVGCLSNENDTVLALPSEYEDYARAATACGIMGRDVDVPVRLSRVSESDMMLFWIEPDCAECERNGGICGFKEGLGYDIGCIGQRSKGLSRGAKYGLTIGAGIPGLLIIIGLSCYLRGRFRTHNRSLARPSTIDHLSARPQLISINGLDGSTIELYPKTLLGESRRLPKPNDNTCPICLSEYQPKETLRTIPECNHYFHAECIDEWLKMNASCPLCRNSPDIGSIHTPTSSSSVATPSSSLLESSSSLNSGR